MNTIATHPTGRIFLHIVCIARRPRHWRTHLAGIAREWAKMEE